MFFLFENFLTLMIAFPSWQPTATIETLQLRAAIVKKTRQFFDDRGFLEVETPILSHYTVTDPHLASFECDSTASPTLYLQTSPEYHMKRLLAAGHGPIFQITKSFRKEEQGRKHNPEFTMLEWYRPGYNHHDLMDEMSDYLKIILSKSSSRLSYQAIFEQYLQINPHTATLAELKNCINAQNITLNFEISDNDTCLEILLSHCIEPHLGLDAPIFIYDYPASQAALSIKHGLVGERFEVYYQGVELANGFHELTDPKEQEARFFENLEKRRELNLPKIPIDGYFLEALKSGLPASAGVALGFDRLVMLALEKNNLQDIMAFSMENA